MGAPGGVTSGPTLPAHRYEAPGASFLVRYADIKAKVFDTCDRFRRTAFRLPGRTTSGCFRLPRPRVTVHEPTGEAARGGETFFREYRVGGWRAGLASPAPEAPRVTVSASDPGAAAFRPLPSPGQPSAPSEEGTATNAIKPLVGHRSSHCSGASDTDNSQLL